ncbi:MAG TPA: hypothetical protein VN688_13045 [Gemmataceae bacterium]|nr:hypothetical protein [Gemmataceae bacterium]
MRRVLSPRIHGLLLAGLLFLGQTSAASAGMPAPLPTDVDRYLVWRVNDSILGRVQAISFFLLVLFVSTAIVRWLWNYLQRDFSRLPRLSYGKTLAGVLLWGLLFIVVLTMISGARELMTPGAWRKQGFTYKLTPEANLAAEPSLLELRKQHLERLRTALWHFAATRNGHFPSESEKPLIPAELWLVPEAAGMRYLYVPGQSASETAALLVYEPEIDAERFALQTNGDIVRLPSARIESLRSTEKRP